MRMRAQLLKDVYPALLFITLLMTWSLGTKGSAGIEQSASEFVGSEVSQSGPLKELICKDESLFMPSGYACMDLTKKDNRDLQTTTNDLHWLLSKTKNRSSAMAAGEAL